MAGYSFAAYLSNGAPPVQRPARRMMPQIACQSVIRGAFPSGRRVFQDVFHAGRPPRGFGPVFEDPQVAAFPVYPGAAKAPFADRAVGAAKALSPGAPIPGRRRCRAGACRQSLGALRSPARHRERGYPPSVLLRRAASIGQHPAPHSLGGITGRHRGRALRAAPIARSCASKVSIALHRHPDQQRPRLAVRPRPPTAVLTSTHEFSANAPGCRCATALRPGSRLLAECSPDSL